MEALYREAKPSSPPEEKPPIILKHYGTHVFVTFKGDTVLQLTYEDLLGDFTPLLKMAVEECGLIGDPRPFITEDCR